MEYKIGDIVELKKQHPCGSKLWQITRVGVDFKFKCMRMWTCNNSRKTESFKNDKKADKKYGGING